ncbi:uncharacterized protein LOC131659092 [Vicia villosa]|uniref:uncharacterized protein LOC131659092 n=1 Tax=Vicia villosa TaxID=3911 RepID=UPI00273CB6DC|nr:uncharacterized protein LOC131659092 [Vicia villosa]
MEFFTTYTIFNSRSEVLALALSIGKEHGITVVTVRSNSSNGIRGRKDRIIMGCERGGTYKRKNASKATNFSDGIYSMKVKRPFRLRSIPSGSGWKVMVRCEMHNHRVENDLEGHNILGRLKDHERKFVNDTMKYNRAPRYIIYSLKDKDPENLTSITQVYKARSTYKVGKRGILEEMQMLLSLIHKDKYMSWIRKRDNSNIVADIFWTHPDSVKLLHMFFFLIFDCTYKTNRYQIPLLEIIGITSTKLTFSVAYAYLEYEREENFTWALEKLKELFTSEKFLPKVVVTDRELALMNAMECN